MSDDHTCPDSRVWGCKECIPMRHGDYCAKCYWNKKDGKHIWWCRENYVGEYIDG